MRFALIGTESDGVEMARALAATKRHELLYVAAPQADPSLPAAKHVVDFEEALADPSLALVLVASRLDLRAQHVRRALQSERPVLCLHPIATRPEGGYEAGMLTQDVRNLLLPLMPWQFHPAIQRLKQILSAPSDNANGQTPPLTRLKLLRIEQSAHGRLVLGTEIDGGRATLPGWEIIRTLGGEIGEIAGFAAGEEVDPDSPLLLTGRFVSGALFHSSLLPHQNKTRLACLAHDGVNEYELLFPYGLDGPAFLTWSDAAGVLQEENWDPWHPWPKMVEVIEQCLAATQGKLPSRENNLPVTWSDEVRALELDDGVRRSVAKGRVSSMEYPEVSEEVAFKSTMTLVGCGVLWLTIVLVILSRWAPALGYGVWAMLGVFIVLQLLRWIIPSPQEGSRP